MDLVDFKEIMKNEMIFHGKQLKGESEKEQRRTYNLIVEKYYDSLSFMSSSALRNSFNQCREHYEYFPKIPQLLKHGPNRKKPEVVISTAISPKAAANIRKVQQGASRYRRGPAQVGSDVAMIATRWPGTDCTALKQRLLEEDALKPENPNKPS